MTHAGASTSNINSLHIWWLTFPDFSLKSLVKWMREASCGQFRLPRYGCPWLGERAGRSLWESCLTTRPLIGEGSFLARSYRYPLSFPTGRARQSRPRCVPSSLSVGLFFPLNRDDASDEAHSRWTLEIPTSILSSSSPGPARSISSRSWWTSHAELDVSPPDTLPACMFGKMR